MTTFVKRVVGSIAELWRYPVKSMLGGTVSEITVTERGVLGDRAWALRDQRTGRIVSAKRVPELLRFEDVYPLAQAARAHARGQANRTRGKLVLHVAS